MVFVQGSAQYHAIAKEYDAIQTDEERKRCLAINVGNAILFCRVCNESFRPSKAVKHLRNKDHKQAVESATMFTESTEVRLGEPADVSPIPPCSIHLHTLYDLQIISLV